MSATSLSVRKIIALLLLPALAFSVNASPAVVQHDLTVNMDPNRGHLEVVDRIRLPDGYTDTGRKIEFYLNAALSPTLGGADATLAPVAAAGPRHLRRYRVDPAGGVKQFTVSYSGKLAQAPGDYALGHVGGEGVYLTGASAWYPVFDDALVRFSMNVRVPGGWTALSQGVDTGEPGAAGAGVRWRETRPQTEIVLLAGRWTAFTRQTADLDARVYLRSPDAKLAERYLDAAADYVALYSRLLGPYPYRKFALAENFWETGYGLPSMALLGPRVIRFPFILHSSFPHEILHNWWGNGVYLEASGGNWSEGLTAYLADHLVQEQRGRGADYRRAALQKYASYVDAADDFPLRAFRGKHGEVSQAVGYNKALMLFHMLRRQLGDDAFLDGLRRFAERHRFARAGYDDLRRALEAASGSDLSFEFRQWVGRTGAPRLRVTQTNVTASADGFRLKGVIEQRQAGAPYRLRVPVFVQIEGRAQAIPEIISVSTKRHAFELELPARPVALHVDPQFDLFRRLAPGELPASLGDLLGAKDAVAVMPAGAPGYARLARALGATTIIDDRNPLPADGHVWLLGWDNARRGALARSFGERGLAFTEEGLKVGADMYRRDEACVVMVVRGKTETRHRTGFIGCDNPGALPGLARKIPHYGKYGFLAFTGDEPVNVRKEEWPVRNSPMTVVFDAGTARLPPVLPQRTPLAGAP